MTLIIATKNEMWADGMLGAGDMISELNAIKIIKKCGCLIGFAGDCCLRHAFEDEYNEELSVINNIKDIIQRFPENPGTIIVSNGEDIKVFDSQSYPTGGYDKDYKVSVIGCCYYYATALLNEGIEPKEVIKKCSKAFKSVGGKIRHEVLG